MSMPTVDRGLDDVVVMWSLWLLLVVYMFSWHGTHCLILWVTRASMEGKWYLSLIKGEKNSFGCQMST